MLSSAKNLLIKPLLVFLIGVMASVFCLLAADLFNEFKSCVSPEKHVAFSIFNMLFYFVAFIALGGIAGFIILKQKTALRYSYLVGYFVTLFAFKNSSIIESAHFKLTKPIISIATLKHCGGVLPPDYKLQITYQDLLRLRREINSVQSWETVNGGQVECSYHSCRIQGVKINGQLVRHFFEDLNTEYIDASLTFVEKAKHSGGVYRIFYSHITCDVNGCLIPADI